MSAQGLRALERARSYCRKIEVMLVRGGSVELIPHLLGDVEYALMVWAGEGGQGDN